MTTFSPPPSKAPFHGSTVPTRLVMAAIALLLIASESAAQIPENVRFEAAAETDAFSPEDWSSGTHGLRLSAGLALEPVNLFGQVRGVGIEYARIAPGTPLFVPSGVDTTFRVAVQSDPDSDPDSVDIALPTYDEWEHGATFPFDRTSRASIFLSGDVALPRDAVVRLTFDGSTGQRVARDMAQLYNPEGWQVGQSSAQRLGASGSLPVLDLGDSRVTLYLDAARTSTRHRTGLPAELGDVHLMPGLGFELGSLELLGEDLGEFDEDVAEALRFDALPPDSLQVFPGRQELLANQTYTGLSQNLRLNPYGMRTGFPISGYDVFGGDALRESRETGTSIALSGDWELAGRNLLVARIEHSSFEVDAVRIPLVAGRGTMMRTTPTHLGLALSDRVTLGRAAIDAGLRYDRIEPGGAHPRIPGFVSFVPDTLRRDSKVADPDGEGLISYTELTGAPCGGFVAPDGQSRCHDNFVEAETRSRVSPHVGFSARFDRAWVRAAFIERMLGPGIDTDGVARVSAAAWSAVLFRNAFSDFATGLVNTASVFGRDVDMPWSRTTELRVGFSPTQRLDLEGGVARERIGDALGQRAVEYTNPVTGSDVFINSVVNVDADARTRIDAHADYRASDLAELGFAWTYQDVDDDDFFFDPYAVLELGPINDVRPLVDPGAERGAFGPGSSAWLDARRQHLVVVSASLVAPQSAGWLADAGVLASARAASGLEYTRLVNQGNGQIGPAIGDSGGNLASNDDERTPWVTWLDLRVHKGFGVLGARLRVFAELSGPLGRNQSQVFLETGGVTNDEHREMVLATLLGDQNMDGDADIDDFFIGDCHTTRIQCEYPYDDDPVNSWSLLRAEQRFGNGDGLFEVSEQRAAFGSYYDAIYGAQWFRRSDRSLSLGLQLVF